MRSFMNQAVAATTALSLFVSLGSSAAALPQGAELSTLAIEGDPIPGTGLRWGAIREIQSGAGSDWVAIARLESPGGSTEDAIVGDPTPDGSQGLAILRRAMTIGGVAQARLGGCAISEGRIGYLAASSSSEPGFESVWIDDQLIAESGDAIGTTGEVWGRFFDLDLRPGGKVFIRGEVVGVGSAVYAVHTDEFLIKVGDSIPNFGGPVASFDRVELSPNGEHSLISIRRQQAQRQALVLDGSLLLVGSLAAVEGRLIDP
ncbi:MAG: hypothetical protein AAGG01_24595, partial [Planctomycetota bacterium]